MQFSKVVSAISFLATLAIGIVVGYVGYGLTDPTKIVVPEPRSSYRTLASTSPARNLPVSIRAQDLIGVWNGKWAQGDCTVVIDRVDGDKFYGTLTENDAKVALVGTVDKEARSVFLHETKVLSIGEYATWSLGTNSGSFSGDGQTLTGTGTDKWGSYVWELTKE
jgi:hypothetical protein